MKIKATESELILRTIPFNVERLFISLSDLPIKEAYHRLICPDWVAIIPIKKNQKVCIIEQERIGIFDSVIELPGGMVDPNDKNNPIRSAQRELEEETGLRGNHWTDLGSFHPNPAFQSNKVHFFLAEECYEPKDRNLFPDETESIKTLEISIPKLHKMALSGQINHALCALGVILALERLKRNQDSMAL